MRINGVYPFDGAALFLGGSDPMANLNSANDEHVVFRGFYFAADFGGQASIAGINFAHFRCASKCADQSTRGRGDNVIESGGMRLAEVGGMHARVGGGRARGG